MVLNAKFFPSRFSFAISYMFITGFVIIGAKIGKFAYKSLHIVINQ